ncbi:PREDICTED: proprotein convertase subtilisin/kexin type 9 [Corvus brachyrhynchos]|uniref:proprotein convertase subtilisin/kexin type 9 n=1 Tax=Corvus brachyrhynchos TaxID=85066 RepID=UPI0008166D2C|nr:PREDICTED: proprotein convertase subtilisin/kexin type 9 [Corvus brachyrhynchos]
MCDDSVKNAQTGLEDFTGIYSWSEAGGELLHVFHLLPAFLVRMSSDVLDTALKLPHVKYIEEDAYVFAQSIPWNLGRIVPPQPSSGAYSPPNKGDLVEIYLLDTSVQSTHREIEGRVTVTGFESIPEEDGTHFHRQASKCDSHGTHVAGVLSGRDAGVATGASIRSLRVLNCQGKGTVSGTLMALEFIQRTLEAQPYAPLVVLLPLAGGHVAVSPVVLTAASRALAGIAAVLLSAEPQLSLAELRQRLLRFSAKNAVDTARLPEEQRLQTPNSVAGLPPRLGAGKDLAACWALGRALSFAGKKCWGESTVSIVGRESPPSCAGDEVLPLERPLASEGVPQPLRDAVLPHPQDKDGQKQCVAHSAFRGRGVYAIARCCTWPRAECRINASSPAAEGAECSPRDRVLTGGSFHSPFEVLGASGSLECRLKEHMAPESQEKVTVSCDDGWTLTGCNALSQSPGSMGAYAVDNSCVAAAVPGSSSAGAIAICCRSWH